MIEEVKWRKPSNPMGVPVWEHIHEGDEIDEKTLKALVRAAVALNTSTAA